MSWWRDRPVLVTGASGLVGGHVVRRLIEQGAEVVCLVRDRVPASQLWEAPVPKAANVVWGDLGDQGLLERALGEYEIDTVIHLAAQTIVGIANRNPVSTFESNIGGTWRLLEAARRSPRVKQVVVASSDKAYGDQPELPYDESAPLDAKFPYDVSKAAAELIARSYAVTWGLPVAITRCGNFYGGGDLNWNRIVPGTIRSILRGQRPIIRSDGEYVRDYFYAEDGADAYLRLAEALAEGRAAPGEAFNFSYERPLSVHEIMEHIRKALRSDLEPEVRNEATHEIRRQYLSAAKARAQLSWTPRVGFDEGLVRTIAWYRAHLGA